MRFPSINDVSAELRNINKHQLEPDDADEGIDVRLQVYPDSQWSVHSGSSDYDQDHRGYWGSSSVPGNNRRFDSKDVARDLIEQAREHKATGATWTSVRLVSKWQRRERQATTSTSTTKTPSSPKCHRRSTFQKTNSRSKKTRDSQVSVPVRSTPFRSLAAPKEWSVVEDYDQQRALALEVVKQDLEEDPSVFNQGLYRAAHQHGSPETRSRVRPAEQQRRDVARHARP